MVDHVNIATLIEHLRTLRSNSHAKVGFNMETYISDDTQSCPDTRGHPCKTVACIAGHCALLAGYNHADNIEIDTFLIFKMAQEWLGISRDAANDLFLPTTIEGYTLDDAIAALNEIIDTDYAA